MEDYETQSNHLMGQISKAISQYPETIQNPAWRIVVMGLLLVFAILKMPVLMDDGVECLKEAGDKFGAILKKQP